MHNYFRPKFIKSQTINFAGLHEIVFKDESKFVGDMDSETIRGKGVFNIQNIGKYEGTFFDSMFCDGKLTLKDWMSFEGRFDDHERIGEGIIYFKILNKKVKIRTIDGFIAVLSILDKGKENNLFKTMNDRSYFYQDSYILSVSEDKTIISLNKVYGGHFFDRIKIDFNVKTNFLEVQNYDQGALSGTQMQVSFGDVPYYQEYETRYSETVTPVYKAVAANGNFFTGHGTFDKGEVTLNTETYNFIGGVEGPHKTGYGYLEFQDGYRKEVCYLKDKIAFDDLGAVFDFVSDFKSTAVPGLSPAVNIDMLRLMDQVESFDGKFDKGTTENNCTIVFKNQNKFVGKLVSFKMHGSGTIYTPKSTISGNFEYGELKYGIIEYNSGGRYEGQLQDLDRHGIGSMSYANRYEFRGKFVNGVVAQQGGKLTIPKKGEVIVIYVHIHEFEIGIFVTESHEYYVVDCSDESVHDARFIEELEKSGINIRESLRNISFDVTQS